MKASCHVTNSINILVVSQRSRWGGNEWPGGGFIGPGEGAGRDGIVGVGSVGGGGAISGVATRTSSTPWVLGTSLDLAMDPGSLRHPDPNESKFVLSVVSI